jgi:hypothetical protein
MVRSALLEFIGKLVGFFSIHVFSQFPLESCQSSQAHPLSFLAGDGLDSRRRVVSIQHKKIRSPAFRAAGVIMAVSFRGPIAARIAKVAFKSHLFFFYCCI